MIAPAAHPQRLGRLTPFDDALSSLVSKLAPVVPRTVPVGEAAGRVAAADIVAAGPVPAVATALVDGYSVAAAETVGAAPGSPLWPATAPVAVDAGGPMPAGRDAVLPPEGLARLDPVAEIVAACAPGDGMRRAGEDVAAGHVLVPAGQTVSALDIAALSLAGVTRVAVREPRIRIVVVGDEIGATVPDAFGPLVGAFVRAHGGADGVETCRDDAAAISAALGAPGAEAAIAIAGTGCGTTDRTVTGLRTADPQTVHGLALRPLETAALGRVGGVPAIALPGRLDAVVAGLLLLVRPMLDALSGRQGRRAARTVRLVRKISSLGGFAEIALLAVDGDRAEPLAVGDAPLSALSRATHWLLVPAGVEGYASDSDVEVSALQGRGDAT